MSIHFEKVAEKESHLHFFLYLLDNVVPPPVVTVLLTFNISK